jgi:acetylornithine deacetylase/succinyl-diaminopimelate desuccinylase-like protein
MIEFLQKLLRIESLSPKDEGCFDLIEDRLNKLNFNCERINYLNVEIFMRHMVLRENFFASLDILM